MSFDPLVKGCVLGQAILNLGVDLGPNAQLTEHRTQNVQPADRGEVGHDGRVSDDGH